MTVKPETMNRRVDRDYVVVRAPEELDIATAPAFVERLEAIPSDAEVTIDLRDLTFCDVAGLRPLLDANRRITAMGGTLTISSPPPCFDELLQFCGLSHHFVRRAAPSGRRRSKTAGTDPARR